VDARVFISDNQNGEDSKTAERQRERLCERDGASLKAKDSISHKTGLLEETFGDGHMQVISESFRCC
jgi:hypothetical protein